MIDKISNLHDWKIERSEQDVRGWDVVDAAGTTLGRVDDLVANTDTERVESVVLDSGRHIPVEEIEIGDRVVRTTRLAPESRSPDQQVTIVRR